MSEPSATTNRIDSSSSRADTNSSSYATGNRSQIGETTTSTVISPLTPSIPPPPPLSSTFSRPVSLIRESPADPTYGTQVRVDELSDNNAQSVYPPSDDTDALKLPPLMPVRRPSQSQHNIQPQSTIISPPVAQNAFTPVSRTAMPANSVIPQKLPWQYSQESYRIPTAQTPQKYPSSRTYGDIPVSFPGVPRMPHQNMDPNQVVKPQTSRRADTLVIADPFQVSRTDDNKARSDGLAAGSVPGPQSLPSMPTFGRNNTAPPSGTYRQGYISTEPGIYLPSHVPRHLKPPSWVPEPPMQPQTPFHMPSIPAIGGDASGQENRSNIHMPPTLPTPVSEPPVQSQAPVLSESPMPSIPHSPIVGLKPDDIVISNGPYTNWQEPKLTRIAFEFMSVTVPRQMYLYILFRLPSLYFSRVGKIFEEANISVVETKRIALQTSSHLLFEPSVSPAYAKLTSSWEFFIDSVTEEWKTFNVVSTLLLAAVLTMLQIQSAAEDPLTRYTALFSLLCALISLIFGCMFVVLFSSMRRIHRAADWALEARRTQTSLWWNVWILLATPAIWLMWSIILFIVCIMSFVWRSGVTDTTPPGISDTNLLAIRVVFTVVLGIGVLNVFLTVNTFRQSSQRDRKWKQRIDGWINEQARASQESFTQPALRDWQNPLMPYASPDGLTMHPPFTYRSSPYYQPSFDDAQGGYVPDTYGPTYASDTYVPPLEPFSTPTGWPHSPLSTDAVTQANIIPNQSPKRQHDDNMTSVAYIPSAGITLPRVPTTSAEETPPRHVPNEAYLGVSPSIPPISGTPIIPFADRSSKNKDNTLGSSSGWENRVGGDVPDNENRVRFRSPLISDQGSIKLANRNTDVEIEVSDGVAGVT
ncbi:hypothetical protein BYT27DRAFT_7155352 [Phlegmacium glaucopus]|nr:hypothetical protein BYT27DRAFT_7155352 [Phlegmacium glaucopus]